MSENNSKYFPGMYSRSDDSLFRDRKPDYDALVKTAGSYAIRNERSCLLWFNG